MAPRGLPGPLRLPARLDRVRVYGIVFDVRELLAYPPTKPMRELNEHHPLRRLSRLANGTSHLDALASPA